MSEVEITPYLPDSPSTIGEDMVHSVRIRNLSNKQLPADTLYLQPNGYFSSSSAQVGPVAPHGSTVVTLRAVVSGHKDISQINPQCTYTYRGTTAVWSDPMYAFIGKLAEFRTGRSEVPRYNILLFGIAGAAKSSFANSVLTCMSRQYDLVTKAAVGGAERHSTLALTRYHLDPFNITLWDTWGLTPDNYMNDDIENILAGVFPNNWEMDWVYDAKKDQLTSDRAVSSRPSRSIHGALFFIPHGSLEKEDERELIKDTFARLRHLNPLLLVTKADEDIPQLRRNPSLDCADVRELKANAARLLNIPQGRIHIVINYTEESKKSFEIDRSIYNILYTVVNNAASHLRLKYEGGSPSKKQGGKIKDEDW